MKKIILLLFYIPLLLASACNNNDDEPIFCTEEAVAGLNVTVVNSQTSIPLVEGVFVTATDGIYLETLQLIPGNEYVFSGAYERQGSYVITVTKSGYETNTSTITVLANECHVIPQQIQISLVSE